MFKPRGNTIMIIEIVRPYKQDPDNTYFKVDSFVNDAWELYDMLTIAFPNSVINMCSHGGFENTVKVSKTL